MTTQLSGRVTVYTQQVPYETDVLLSNSWRGVDIAKLAETILGTGISNIPLVSGLPCLPTAIQPPLAVTVGAGCLYQFENYEPSTWGVLPADTDTNHRLYKQALSFDPVTLATPAPITPGDTIIYLIQGAFFTEDVNIVNRPYFNSADPTSPIFASLPDTRIDRIILEVKTGVSAPSPVPPTPDPGFVPLYYVTVPFGHAAIVPADITYATNAPFILESLTQKIGYQSIRANTFQFYLSTGTANALVVAPSPAYPGLATGLEIKVFSPFTNTGASTFQLGVNPAKSIVVDTPLGFMPLVGGEIPAFSPAYLFYSQLVDQFVLTNPAKSRAFICSLHMGASQLVSAVSTATLNFDTVEQDDFSWFHLGTSIKPTIAGWYSVNTHFVVQSSTLTTTLRSRFARSDGANFTIGEIALLDVAGFWSQNNEVKVHLNGTTEYVSVLSEVSGTGNINFNPGVVLADTRFQLTYLGS